MEKGLFHTIYCWVLPPWVNEKPMKYCNFDQLLNFDSSWLPVPISFHNQGQSWPENEVDENELIRLTVQYSFKPNFTLTGIKCCIIPWWRHLAAQRQSQMRMNNYKPCPIQWRYQNCFGVQTA